MTDKCCYLCSSPTEELRPYGPNGSWVCFSCAMKPENLSETEKQFNSQLDSAIKSSKGVIVLGEETGPRPLHPVSQPH